MCRDVCDGAPVKGDIDAGIDGFDGHLRDALAYGSPFGDERASAPTTGDLTLPAFR
jgi:hypothetical protein